MGASESKSKDKVSLNSVLAKNLVIVNAKRVFQSCYEDTHPDEIEKIKQLIGEKYTMPKESEVKYPNVHVVEKAAKACTVGDIAAVEECLKTTSPNALVKFSSFDASTLIEHIYTSNYSTFMNTQIYDSHIAHNVSPAISMQLLYLVLMNGAKITSKFEEEINRADKNPELKKFVKQLRDAGIQCFESKEEKEMREKLNKQITYSITSILKNDESSSITEGQELSHVSSVEVAYEKNVVLFLNEKKEIVCIGGDRTTSVDYNNPNKLISLHYTENSNSELDLKFTSYTQILHYCSKGEWPVQITGKIAFLTSDDVIDIQLKSDAASTNIQETGLPTGFHLDTLSVSKNIMVCLKSEQRKLFLYGNVEERDENVPEGVLAFQAKFVCLIPLLCTKHEYDRFCTSPILNVYRSLKISDLDNFLQDNVTIGKSSLFPLTAKQQQEDPFSVMGQFFGGLVNAFSGNSTTNTYQKQVKTDSSIVICFNSSIANVLPFPETVQFMQELYQEGKMQALIINAGEKDQQRGIIVDVCIENICYQSALSTEVVPFKSINVSFDIEKLPPNMQAVWKDLSEFERSAKEYYNNKLTAANEELQNEIKKMNEERIKFKKEKEALQKQLRLQAEDSSKKISFLVLVVAIAGYYIYSTKESFL